MASYLQNVLFSPVLKRTHEPTPTLHRSGAGVPVEDLVDPDVADACSSSANSSVVCVWRKTGGGATATLDLQVILWDPIGLHWDYADVITNVAPGQVIVLPTGGCRFFVKIVGVDDELGITDWSILLRPWDKR